ncbi:MAG: glycosyltransferase family 4 protein [Candidatus Sericytochromatia bacterium]|nr:glycosyltransferase family 4 protein [Candidatus Tanganyikabacteria bacterium]
MRLAMVALSCPAGGMLHYSSQLANALSRDTDLAFYTPWQPDLATYFDRRIALRRIVPLNRAGDRKGLLTRQVNPFLHLATARQILRHQPGIVHLVTDHPANSLVVRALRLLGHRAVVLTHHDPVRHPGETSRLKDVLTGMTVAAADRVVVHGDTLARDLAAQGVPSTKVVAIPHGDYGFLRRHASGAPEEPLILCFGRILPYKGLDVLCRAERLLGDQLGEYRICIAGAGDPACFAGEIGPSGRVSVRAEFLPDAEVASLFERARLVVLPYTQATQSGVLAVAFAFGKPAIVSDVGGLPEAVGYGRAGRIVPAGDPAALAAAIAGLWHDPAARAALGQAGRERISAEIGWPIVASRHLEMYRDLGSKGASSTLPVRAAPSGS